MIKPAFNGSKLFFKYFDKIYEGRDYSGQVLFIESIMKKHDISGPIVDLGCGTGEHLRLFAKKGYVTIGVDSSKEMIKIAREKVRGRFMVAPISGVKFRDIGAFISLYCSINYNDKKKMVKTLKNIYLSLKKGGVAVIETRDFRAVHKKPHITLKKIGKKTLVCMSSWKKSGKMSSAYTVALLVMNGNMVEEYSEDMHELNFLSPSWMMGELKKIGFDARLYDGFTAKREMNVNTVLKEPVIVAFKPY